MSTNTKSIEVEQPIQMVYDQWTQFEEFPSFMEGVESVTQISDRTLHWSVEIAGVTREFDATITNQRPDRGIAWATQNGPYQAGMVTFEPVGAERTLVTLRMDFEPEGFTEKAGDALGFVSRRIEGDLERFKHFIEARDSETGAWRKEIPESTSSVRNTLE